MEEEWKALNGCNECISNTTCEKWGNCILLSIDSEVDNECIKQLPKKKRKLIARIQLYGSGHAKQLKRYTKILKKIKSQENIVNIDLTSVEKMCIKALNKKR